MRSSAHRRLRRLLPDVRAGFQRRRKLRKLLRVARAVMNDELTYYPSFVRGFEQRFAEFVGCEHGLTFCNGTSALEAALFAVGVRGGDEVLVPGHTFHASISPILNAGACPVFVDIDPGTQTLDPGEIPRKVTPATKCMVVVHLFGNPADMGRIVELAGRHGLRIVEDCSHAHGASFAGRKVGSFGDVGCFSLQGDKAVSAGEGGIAVTKQDDLLGRLRLFGHFGRDSEGLNGSWPQGLLETGVGHKTRANPLGICMAQVDLDHLHEGNAARREVASRLVEIVGQFDGLRPVESYPDAQRGGFYPGLAVRFETASGKSAFRQELVDRLRERGIPAACYPYGRYHKMPHMADPEYRSSLLFDATATAARPDIALASLPATEAAQESTFLLPLPESGGSHYVQRVQEALSALPAHSPVRRRGSAKLGRPRST